MIQACTCRSVFRPLLAVCSFVLLRGVVDRNGSTYASAASSPTVSSGLANLGNTCYMNAQLQSSFHIPRVRQIIASPVEDRSNVALLALQALFHDMASSSRPAIPKLFCQALGIPVVQQQDSQEFWKLLLPALNLNSLCDLYQGSYEDYIKSVAEPIRERKREEAFLDLSLELSSDSVLESLQQQFQTAELLSEAEGNGWRPEKGADKVDALKGSLLKVQGLPSILQLHFKRFNYNWQTDTMSKINSRFSFPKELDLSEVCTDIKAEEKEDSLYLLQSIIIHAGNFGSGHYYAYVRPDIRSDDWYRFNDHVVTKVSFSEVVADSVGGVSSAPKVKRGFFGRLAAAVRGAQLYGWGGQTSNAYVVQYIKNRDVDLLYANDDESKLS